jgi:hypothetical protein
MHYEWDPASSFAIAVRIHHPAKPTGLKVIAMTEEEFLQGFWLIPMRSR